MTSSVESEFPVEEVVAVEVEEKSMYRTIRGYTGSTITVPTAPFPNS